MFIQIFFQVIWITQWCPVIGFGLSISHTAIQVQEETMKCVYHCAKSFSRALWTSVSLYQLTNNLWMNKFPKRKQNNTVSYLMLMYELTIFALYWRAFRFILYLLFDCNASVLFLALIMFPKRSLGTYWFYSSVHIKLLNIWRWNLFSMNKHFV